MRRARERSCDRSSSVRGSRFIHLLKSPPRRGRIVALEGETSERQKTQHGASMMMPAPVGVKRSGKTRGRSIQDLASGLKSS